ncbi:Poly-gamma-glutamate synthase PgsB OS=Streptomyces alboniger OX=132473 GN=pgsB PE=4 SV=1 [Streptomyces alboniger]
MAIGNIHGQGELLLEHLAELPADESEEQAPEEPAPFYEPHVDPYQHYPEAYEERYTPVHTQQIQQIHAQQAQQAHYAQQGQGQLPPGVHVPVQRVPNQPYETYAPQEHYQQQQQHQQYPQQQQQQQHQQYGAPEGHAPQEPRPQPPAPRGLFEPRVPPVPPAHDDDQQWHSPGEPR